MLDLLYLTFFLLSLGYFLVSPRKEIPLILLAHMLLQYGLTQLLWFGQVGFRVAGLLLLFLILSSGMLLWGRRLNYSRELHAVQAFFSLAQWAVLIGVGIFLWVKSPYQLSIPSANWHSPLRGGSIELQPLAKVGVNFLVFSTFLHIVLGWGRRWSLRRSFQDLLPLFLYFGMLIFLILNYENGRGLIVS